MRSRRPRTLWKSLAAILEEWRCQAQAEKEAGRRSESVKLTGVGHQPSLLLR
ncbi:rCG55733 [Rattus norvegicus]|uniref:RCG55733 n=1 Tax=Rattus norvegicus TaxID=10116 RepID=A6JLX1_RAT|nr:rCG55733 [Rattus norvegicus]